MPNDTQSNHPAITVSDFVLRAPAQLGLGVLAGSEGLAAREISLPRIQKIGLALAGFENYIHPGRLQIAGRSDISYLSQLSIDGQREAIGHLGLDRISCILITTGLEPPAELVDACEHAALPLVRTPLVSSSAIILVTEYLQEMLAPRILRHGVLLDIYGLGVLIEGESGIGKSECALDLISRGHRLVSDDVVEVRRIGSERLLGRAPELVADHLEIRGLGIINIRDLFGVSSISATKNINLSIRFERWDDSSEIDRLGIDARTTEILGLDVPQVLLPVSSGRNLTTLVETAVRIHLLRRRGYDAARAFVDRHTAMLADGTQRWTAQVGEDTEIGSSIPEGLGNGD